MPIRLADITIDIRLPRENGAERLARAIRELSPRSRRLRFLSDRSDYTLDELEPFLRPDGDQLITLVAALLNHDGREIDQIGIGHVVRLSPDSDSADVALVVCDRYHGHGVGAALIEALALASRKAGISKWEGICAGENQAALALLRKVGTIESLGCSEGICEFSVSLA